MSAPGIAKDAVRQSGCVVAGADEVLTPPPPVVRVRPCAKAEGVEAAKTAQVKIAVIIARITILRGYVRSIIKIRFISVPRVARSRAGDSGGAPSPFRESVRCAGFAPCARLFCERPAHAVSLRAGG
jgi:hypothetical protein